MGTVLGSRPAGGDTRGLRPDDRRLRAAVATIRLDEPVGKGDLLELRHDDEFDRFLTAIAEADAEAGSTIECRVPRAMPHGSRVRIIRSQAAIDTAAAALKRDIARKRAVDVRVTARLGGPFEVVLTCCDDPSLGASATGFIVEAARTRAVSPDDLVEHVGRMGSSPFEAASFDIQLDEGCGMSFSAVHKVRGAACDALVDRILAPYAERRGSAPRAIACPQPLPPARAEAPVSICATVRDLEAAVIARDAGAQLVYMPVDALLEAGFDAEAARAGGIVPVLDEVCRAADLERLDPWVLNGSTVAVGNISELARASQVGARAEIRPCIPVHNRACMEMLERRGADAVWLSPELSLAEIERLAPGAPVPVGIAVYGRPRVMTSEHCILQVADACIHDCARCGLRRRDLRLRNIDGKEFPVRTDIHGRSHLYGAEATDITPQIPQLLNAGVSRFMVDGTLLDASGLKKAVTRTRTAVEAARNGNRPAPRSSGTTTGCLFVGVD